MLLNDKQRQIGQDNFNDAVRLSRRQMLSAAAAIPVAGAMVGGAMKLKGDPVKVGIIGTGNQGCQAHIAQSNPDYIEFVAYSDIRPSSQERAREEFNKIYGKDKASKIKLYPNYKDLLDQQDIEMVIIAVPLAFHAPIAIDAMDAGKHVLCEKLMAKSVMDCKQMIRKAVEKDKFLSIGHQRHYNYLYDNAVSLIENGLLGDIRFINAWWHRNFAQPRTDGWSAPIDKKDKDVKASDYGYKDLDQLVHWRIDPEIGGGLMVELGSHQVDAASIFLGHKLPIAVSGTGVISYFDGQDGRSKWNTPDHVFLNFEFGEDAKNAVVTYSSISTNQFQGFGEQVFGSNAALALLQESSAYLYKEPFYGDIVSKDTRVGIATEVKWQDDVLGEPTADSGSTAAWGSSGGKADTLTSRGYREEQEHMAWLIREFGGPSKSGGQGPRCDGQKGLNDAVIALVANMAMQRRERIELKKAWFDVKSDANPEQDLA